VHRCAPLYVRVCIYYCTVYKVQYCIPVFCVHLCAVKLHSCICICIIICMLSGSRSVWSQRHVIDLSDVCTFVWCVCRTPKLPDNSLRSARPLYRPGTNYHALSEAGPKNPHNMNTAFEQQRQSILSTGALRIRRQQEAVSGVYQHSDDFWKNASGRVMHVKQRNDRVERQA